LDFSPASQGLVKMYLVQAKDGFMGRIGPNLRSFAASYISGFGSSLFV